MTAVLFRQKEIGVMGSNSIVAQQSMHSDANFEQLREAMIEANYITPQQFDEDLARLNNPSSMMPSSILWSAWGKRP